MYGSEDFEGISPTEREFEHASKYYKTRLIFLTQNKDSERHPKELSLIKKAQQVVIRKQFKSIAELKSAVYIALIRYLEEKEFIRTTPFDATFNNNAKLNSLDFKKIRDFVNCSISKRGFPLSAKSNVKDILVHLNLMEKNNICNAAILLFGKEPQRFFLSSEIKCAQFYGNEIVKPIKSYQVYKGDVFQLVNQAVDFVMSKIDVSVLEKKIYKQKLQMNFLEEL